MARRHTVAGPSGYTILVIDDQEEILISNRLLQRETKGGYYERSFANITGSSRDRQCGTAVPRIAHTRRIQRERTRQQLRRYQTETVPLSVIPITLAGGMKEAEMRKIAERVLEKFSKSRARAAAAILADMICETNLKTLGAHVFGYHI